jgi:hypothetical protein
MALTLIAVMTYWVAFVWSRFAYFDDDLVLFGLARHLGLTWQYLGYSVYEEFSPLDHLFYTLELWISPLNNLVGMVIAGIVLLTMLLTLNWALKELGASDLRRAVAVGVVGTCLPVLTITSYWGQSIYIPTACVFVLAIVAAHLRAVRLHSLRWHVMTFVFSIGGALISERTLFTPLFLVAIDAGLIGCRGTWGQAVRGVWQQRYSYGALLAISVAGALFIAKFYYQPYPSGGIGPSLRLIAVTYTRWFVPALVGFWRFDGVSKLAAVVVGVLSLVAAGVAIVVERRNCWALILFGGVFCAFYGFLGVGRLGIYPEHVLAADVQYMVWVLPLSAAAMGLVVLPSQWAGWWARARGWAAVGVAVLLVASSVDGVVSLNAGGVLTQRASAAEYFTNLRAETAELSTGKLSVMPLDASVTVAALFIAPYNRLTNVLPLIDPSISVGALDVGASPVVIDSSGFVRSAVLVTDTDLVTAGGNAAIWATGGTLSRAAGDLCFTSESSEALLRLTATTPVAGATLMAELTYTSARATTVRFTTVNQDSYTINGDVARILQGSHTALFSLDGVSAISLQMSGLRVGLGLCIHSLAIVHPVVVDGNGGCSTVDQYGDVGSSTPCPSPDPSAGDVGVTTAMGTAVGGGVGGLTGRVVDYPRP